MKLLHGVIGSAIGGTIGAAIWAAVSYFLHVESGWIAVAVGALAGFGMALGSSATAGITGGVLACVIALLSIAGGKFAAIEFAVSRAPQPFGEQYAISFLADYHVRQFEAEGKQVRWPGGSPSPDGAMTEAEYPTDVWALAEADWAALPEPVKDVCLDYGELAVADYRTSVFADQLGYEWEADGRELAWPDGAVPYMGESAADYPADLWRAATEWEQSLSPDEQASILQPIADTQRAGITAQVDKLKWQAFKATLSPFDALWVFLALGAAFKLGAAEPALEGSSGNGATA